MTTECPVTAAIVLAAMCRGEFKPFTKVDHDAYAGCEGDGFTGELEGCQVILDSGPGGVGVNVYQPVENDVANCWVFELTGSDPEHIGEV